MEHTVDMRWSHRKFIQRRQLQTVSQRGICGGGEDETLVFANWLTKLLLPSSAFVEKYTCCTGKSSIHQRQKKTYKKSYTPHLLTSQTVLLMPQNSAAEEEGPFPTDSWPNHTHVTGHRVGGRTGARRGPGAPREGPRRWPGLGRCGGQ